MDGVKGDGGVVVIVGEDIVGVGGVWYGGVVELNLEKLRVRFLVCLMSSLIKLELVMKDYLVDDVDDA